jgi:hypothetical protein
MGLRRSFQDHYCLLATEGEPWLASLCALLGKEWVLRSRYKASRKAMASAFDLLLETPGIEFEHDATVEEAL